MGAWPYMAVPVPPWKRSFSLGFTGGQILTLCLLQESQGIRRGPLQDLQWFTDVYTILQYLNSYCQNWALYPSG